MSRLRGEGGSTLLELLVSMTIAAVVFGATLTLLEVFQRNNTVDLQRNELQDNARNGMDQIIRQLRNVAAPSAGAAGALLVTKKYSMIFDTIDSTSGYAWGQNTSHTMMVRYCLNNSNNEDEVLWMQVKRWKEAEGPKTAPAPTTCPDLSGYWESSRQVTDHITNRIGGEPRELFKYSATTTPQTDSLEVDMYLNLTPGRPHPGETRLTSGVALRNANRPPIVAFTVTQVNEFVRLDGSASYDPDGLALTYKWSKDGTPLSSTAQVVEVKETQGPHTYELEVTDPGGLAEKKSETVTIK
ncbi:MAG TPA: PKD domain-containing protein [Solirubrobacteraceae bacterium]|nr:PKD domain-containing protein [Solirubrobacteraceae bacterium]